MRREAGVEQRTTTLELFYDLVFVFAVTQVSHLVLDHLTWEGVGQATIVLLVVWWSWNYTTWVTNDRDPGCVRREGAAVRGLLRRHPGRPPPVPDLRRRRARHDRTPPRRSHPGVVRGGRRAVDRRRDRRRRTAHAILARRPGARLRGTAGDVLGARTRAD